MTKTEAGDPPPREEGPGGALPGDDIEARLTADERRLSADERRLEADERRLAADEERLELEERSTRRNWWLVLALAALLALTIVALVLSVIALNRDIEAVAKADPKDDSVGTVALKQASVTGEKIAPGAVGTDQLADGAVTSTQLAEASVTGTALAPRSVGNLALAPGSVGTKKLIPGAVVGASVAPDTLTGENIRESTIGQVPLAKEAQRADTARNAQRLGGLGAAGYLSEVTLVEAATETTGQPQKGPIAAACPDGTRVLGGGAVIEGVPGGVALTGNGPDAEGGWVASAQELGELAEPWRIVVTAICAAGGAAPAA